MACPLARVKVSRHPLTAVPPVLAMVTLLVRPLFQALTVEVTRQDAPPAGGVVAGVVAGGVVTGGVVRTGVVAAGVVGVGLPPSGATARPGVGEIIPAHRPRLAGPE